MHLQGKWSKEDILQQICEAALQNNGIAVSSKVSSRLRQCVVKEYGSWKNACQAAGVNCPSMMDAKRESDITQYEIAERAKTDVSAGLRIHSGMTSICFECAKSAAPKELRCSWDAELVLPKGAIYDMKITISETGERIDLPVVLFCPQFVANEDLNFQQKVRLARKQELAKIVKEEMGGEGGKVKR